MNYLGNGELIHTPFNDSFDLSLKGVSARYFLFFQFRKVNAFHIYSQNNCSQ